MKTYSIIYSDGYWELCDGTMIDNGSPFPLLSHKDKDILFAKVMFEIQGKCLLDIYDQYGKLEKQIEFPMNKGS